MIHCIQITNRNYKILVQSFANVEEDFPNSDETLNQLRISLKKIIESDGISPFIVNINTYTCYIFQSDVFIQIIADKNELKDKISLFFKDLENNFLKMEERNMKYPEFEKELCFKIKQFNKRDSLKNLEANLENVKSICYESLNVVTKRGEKLETLGNMADNLDAQVKMFQKSVEDSFADGFWKKYFVYLVCLLLIVLIFLKYYFF